jgi:predicted MPP superfamily phosphohydrolase
MGQLTLSIGDVHGESTWKQLGDIKALVGSGPTISPKYDKYIFVGDYVDSFNRTDEQVHNNLQEIIAFKEKYPAHVILLWGNHDIQYLFEDNSQFICSGYRPTMYPYLHELFDTKKDLFQLAYGYGNTLWTHAGVHASWYRKAGLSRYYGNTDKIAEKLNEMFDNGVPDIFDVGFMRGGMYDFGGPLWCDKSKLYKHPLEDINQIVGHTHSHTIEEYMVNGNMIAFIDSLYDDDPILSLQRNIKPRGFVYYVNQ